jgi:hypothetical protein
MTRLPFGVACEQDKSRTAAASLPATMSSRVNTSRSHSYNIAHTFSLQDVNIDAQNNTGATAIVIAAKDGHADIVYALLERGANVSIEANEVRNTSRLFLTHPSPHRIRSRAHTTLTIAVCCPTPLPLAHSLPPLCKPF